MTNMIEHIEKAFASRSLREDEYLNEANGLIYCRKCQTPRQTRIAVFNKTITPSVLCKCEKERRGNEEAERQRRAFMDRVSRLKANGLQDKAYRDYTFANDLGYNPEIKNARIYVDHWEEMRATSSGILLWGDVGTGKTFIAGCIANALLDKGIPVLMTNFARILNTLTNMYAEDRNGFIDSLNEYSLLIIDDLGMERNSGFALEQVFSVIDSRYRSKKPLIVTTNLTLSEMKHPADISHARIYDRVLERCVPICINRQNIREMNSASNIARMKDLFSAEEK